MASKRPLQFTTSASGSKKPKATPERELSPCDISSPEANATVKGVVMSLSPEKCNKKVFFGELSYGDTVIPLVGFDKHHRDFLLSRMDSATPVTLRGCQISTNKTTGKLQVVIKTYTSLEESKIKTSK